jgi:polyamine oxidase
MKLAASILFTLQFFWNVDAGDQVDVIIIGAGMAGAAATKTLMEAGPLKVKVLEARNRIGGRVHPEHFGDPAIHRGVIELGANWIHGAGDNNPIWSLAKQTGLRGVHVIGGCANVSNYALFDRAGHQLSRQRSKRIMDAVECINRTAQQPGPDMTEADALKKCSWQIQDDLDAAMEWEISAANDILSPDELSLQYNLPDPTNSELGPDDHFIHDQRERGYATLIDKTFGDAIETGGSVMSFDDISLNAEVVKVDSTHCDLVRVTTRDGRQFSSRFVISTLPLGVLQRSDVFNPPLSSKQLQALSAATMGNFTKIFVQWQRNFWSSRGIKWLAATSSTDRFGGPMEFHDLDALVPGFNTLFAYVDGASSQEWEALSDQAASEQFVRRLQTQFPDVKIPSPSAFRMSRHGSDPFQGGAYTTGIRFGTTTDQIRALSLPTGRCNQGTGEARVFFAGEHSCEKYQGFLHGAYFSGARAAAEVLKAMGKDVDPKLISTCHIEDRQPVSNSSPSFIV